MNAAVIVYSYFSRDTRAQRYADALQKEGYHVDVYSLAEDTPDKNFHFSYFPLMRKRINLYWYFIEYLLFFIYTMVLIAKNYFKKKYKVIHVFNMPDILVFATIIPKIFGSKIVFDIRDLSSLLFQTKYKVSGKNFIVRLLWILTYSSIVYSDKTLTANKLFKEILVKQFKSFRKKIMVAYECANQSFFYPQRNKKEKKGITLIYYGTIEKRFAVKEIIEAMNLVIRKLPYCKLKVIPKIEKEGNYFNELLQLVESSAVRNNIIIYPPLPFVEIAKQLRKSDIGLVLVEKDEYTDIIYRIKLYELIACKIPVIATKTKFLSRSFSSNEIFFIKNNTPQELFRSITRLALNRRMQNFLAENAFRYYKTCNWDKEGRKYSQLLHSLITHTY